MNSIGLCENQNDFIMLPKVDFCFKEIMQNEKVRQGLIAALLESNLSMGHKWIWRCR